MKDNLDILAAVAQKLDEIGGFSKTEEWKEICGTMNRPAESFATALVASWSGCDIFLTPETKKFLSENKLTIEGCQP